MHHHGGVGGRVGTASRMNILRGRKKLSLAAKYMFSYFRSFLYSRSMEKAEERAVSPLRILTAEGWGCSWLCCVH